MPGTNRETEISLDDVLQLQFDYELKKGHATFKGTFTPNPLLNVLYGTFGYYDYHIAVRDFLEQDSKTTSRTLKALLRLYPIDSHGRAIPQTGTVSEATFRSKTAKYLIDSLETERKDRNCEQHLCLAELPDNLPSLEVTVNAFEFLYERRNSAVCTTQESDGLCVERIEAKFTEALESDPNNSFARLGLGLAQLRHVGLSLSEASAAAVGRLLMEAIANVSSAKRHSEYIANLMSTTEWTEMVQRTPGLAEFPITLTFVETADGYRRARRAFVQAEYSDVPKALAQIRDLPTPLAPHIRNLELSALLLLASTSQEAEPLLKEFKELSHSDTDGTWFATYGFYLCRWSLNSPKQMEESLAMIDSAIDLSGKDFVAYLDRRAQKGICLASIERDGQARNILDSVAKDLLDHGDHPKDGFQRIYYDLGVGYALVGNFKRAGDFLTHAVSINSVYLTGISKLNLLESFRDWGGYEHWRSNELSRINEAREK